MPESGQQGQQPGGAPGPTPAGATAPVDVPAPPAVDRMQRFTAANMIRSLVPLVLGCLLVVGVAALRQNPDDPVREVDTTSAERTAAERASYELLVPRGLSDDWRPTSVRTNAGQATVGDPVTLQIGWLTPEQEFAQYVVSDDPEATALTDLLEDTTEDGTEQVGGESWQRLTTERGEALLTRSEGAATLVVTGSASDAELDALAGSLQPYAP
ncbi:DUF4245 domain-containing protein [Modestobacter versicolor]|uniref:DUF4245 domain-containing protein n=1 Tax=Modestobacter versicolor TaxID=429133 RepID=A0A323V7K5_9ACTN|nr:DUF4245 domain-containing protein [Modestobacter versicolor]MBB3676484.1 hypothetical protein [Modestobacter versicolor]PZA20742.1 DUF4245 domain-containing protein [Modestobacter versicolor]